LITAAAPEVEAEGEATPLELDHEALAKIEKVGPGNNGQKGCKRGVEEAGEKGGLQSMRGAGWAGGSDRGPTAF
jgi:hypothetical protein